MTIEEIAARCAELIAEGKGDYIITVPNYGDYVSWGEARAHIEDVDDDAKTVLMES